MANIIVMGGGIGGCAAALALAKAGHQVTLTEGRSFVAHELTATGHCWLRNGSGKYEFFCPSGTQKKAAMQKLLDAGVRPLLLSEICGIGRKDGRACGVVLGNAFGMQYLPADGLVDATPRAAAWGYLPLPDGVNISYTFLCGQARTLYETALDVPEAIGLTDHRVLLHPTLLPNVMAVEIRFAASWRDDPLWRPRTELLARKKARQAFEYLRSLPRLQEIRLKSMAGEIRILETAQPAEEIPGAVRFSPALPLDISTLDLENCLRDAEKALSGRDWTPQAGDPDELILQGKFVPRFSLLPPQERLCGMRPVQMDLAGLGLPSLHAQAIVAGMGTAGAHAVLGLMEEGVKTAVIEPFYQPGGTRTVGRVCAHYYGNIAGSCKKINDEVAAFSREINGPGTMADTTARCLRYQQALDGDGCLPLLGYTACGALKEGQAVTGVAACSGDGMALAFAPNTIDTTSDADVAVFAGVKYDFGSPRDGSVMTNGQWGDSEWKHKDYTDPVYHRDYDVICNDDYGDLLRGIIQAHGFNSDLDFSPLNTMRESRRIHGRHTLTLREVALHQPLPDVVAQALTPYDTHGRASSVLIHMGMLRYDINPLRVQIPYGCFLPRDVEGLLVGGKALSATRDAMSLCRMNADIENAGYALGLAAAQAAREGKPVSRIDVSRLREKLFQAGCLWEKGQPEKMDPILHSALEKAGCTWDRIPIADEITPDAAAEMLRAGRSDALLAAILQPREQMLPRLIALARDPDAAGKRDIAMARCWFGDAEGVRQVLQLLKEAPDLADWNALRAEKGYGLRRTTFEGEIGAYHWINRYIALLGVAGDKCALPELIRLTEAAHASGEPVLGENPYHRHRLDSRLVPGFDRIACLTFALERMADESARGALERLLEKPHLHGYLRLQETDEENFPGCAWLELCIARALARCGGKAGYLRLAEYTADIRKVYALHARRELEELTGQHWGADPDAWKRWIEAQPAFPCRPYTAPVQVD